MTKGIANLVEPSAAEMAARRRRALTAACGAHLVHDGYLDLIYVLLPIWQAEFGLGYAALGLVRAAYSVAMASAQVPVDRWLAPLGSRRSLALGTLVSAAGFAFIGFSSGLVLLCAALVVAGLGSSTQHPRGSVIVTQAYGAASRGALGIYNFAGDLGKAIFPALTSLLLLVLTWRHAMLVLAAIGAAAALALGAQARHDTAVPPEASTAGRSRLGLGFAVLFVIGVLDSAPRMGFLLLLPFVLKGLGASQSTIGVGLALVFAGGAFGKFACGWIGARLGLVGTVAATEGLTAAMLLAVPFLPLGALLAVLPILGTGLNGTSSVLYGTVPDVIEGRDVGRADVGHADVGHAFAVFYTGVIGASAGAPVLFGALADATGRPAALVAAAVIALSTIPLTVALARRMRRSSPVIDTPP